MTEFEKEDIKRVAELCYDWDRLSNKTLLISGGTGLIGQFIIGVLKYRNSVFGNNIKVISLSRRPLKTESNITYVKCDINEKFEIDGKADFILHLASNTHPKQYGEDPVGTITTNILGCINLLEIAKRHNARFLLASSVEIYGDGDGNPINESYCGKIDCNTARAGYNEAKRVCESLCQSYRKQFGTDFVTARLARCFGADRKNDSKALAQFIQKAVTGEDIILKSKGTQRFSYCYVADAASGILKILLDGISGEAYNVADADERKTLGDYAEFIASLAGKKVIFDISEDSNASKALYAVLDCAKLETIGWKTLYSVSEGLKRTYDIIKLSANCTKD